MNQEKIIQLIDDKIEYYREQEQERARLKDYANALLYTNHVSALIDLKSTINILSS